MNVWHDKYGTRHVDSAAAPDYSIPLWAQDARINRATGMVDRYVPVELHNAHVRAWKECDASLDSNHRWAEEHGEDINEPFAELTELQGEL